MDNTITIPRGNTHCVKISINVNGEPYTLADGDIVYFTVKTYSGGEVKIKKQLTATDINSEGELILTLNPSDTANLAGYSYSYDAAIRFANGEIYTFIKPSTFAVCDVITEAGDIYG